MDQNIDSSGLDQIQTSQYPIIHRPSQEMSEEIFQAKGDLMKSIRTFLEKFNRYPFGVMPKILSQAWEKYFSIHHAQSEDTNELFQKLFEDLQIIREELLEYINSPKKSPDAIAPILSTEEPKYSLSMRYKHLNTTSETESYEIIKSGVEELVPIPKEYEVTSKDKRECDMLVCEDSSTFDDYDDHSKILSDSNNNDISSNDDAFEDIEYVEASIPDLELVSLHEENDVYQEEEEFKLEDTQDVTLREKLLSINRLIANIESLNDNPTPDRMLKSSASIPIFEESDNSLSDNFSPEFETFSDHTKETRSGSTTTHANNSLSEYDSFCFEIKPDQEKLTSAVMNDISDDSSNDPLLEEVDLFLASDNLIPQGIENFGYDSEGDIHFLKELLIDDSIPFPDNEASDFDYYNNPSFLCPPPKTPDVEFFFDSKPDVFAKEILDELNEDECFNPGVFKQGDDPIDAINHMMSFLSAVFTSRYPTTNSQLRNSLNLRKQATINDGRVTLQPVQERQVSFDIGEGYMSKQCTKPKRKQDDAWFKEKVLLVQAQTNGQILHKEELAFLVDPEIAEGQAIQTVITHNVDYQANDLDAYDFNYDELNTSKVALMAIYLIMVEMFLLSPSCRPTNVEVSKELPKVSMVVQIILLYLDSGCSKHMTEDRSQLTNFINKFFGTVKFKNDHVAKIMGYEDYQIGNVTISMVYYVEGIAHNLFSVRKFCDSKLKVAFCQHTCFIRNLEGEDLLTGSRGNNLYTLSIGDMMASSPIFLLSKALKTKSWLWHQRLSHLNIGAINHLARHDLVRGLAKLKLKRTICVLPVQ
nr:integrase, catalytic region, zinc finger, CCHC-type, peptidase aspartic, catalytic [Tanacetum cinerariifolium]